ncbi:MAG: hypothetical protein AAF598_03090 [Bacteroidota bacterium]
MINRLLFLGIVSLIATVTFGQANRTPFKKKEPVYPACSLTEARHLFKDAQLLKAQGEMVRACQIYFQIRDQFPEQPIGQLASSYLQQYQNQLIDAFQEQLIGNWEWIWSGSNWGTAKEPETCDCSMTYQFTNDSLFIFKDQVLDTAKLYQISIHEQSLGWEGNGPIFLLNVDSSNWPVRLNPTSYSVFAMMNLSNQAIAHLQIVQAPIGWVCGAPEVHFQGFD